MRVSPLRAAIQDKQFSPAYFFFGEDEFLKEEGLRQLIGAAVDASTRDFNLDQRRGDQVDAESLGSLLGMPPMMAERRVVVIRDVTGLRKDARAVLDKHLQAPAPDILVALTAPADAKTDRALEELAVPVDCAPLTGAQVPKWITARAERLGARIAPEAIELLQSAVGSDLSQLAIELDKLASFCADGRVIDEEAVSQVVGVRKDEAPGRLLDAVAMREGALAVSLLPGVLQQPKMGGVPLVMALTTQMLALAVIVTRAVPPARQSNEFYQLLRSGSSNMTGRSWGEAVSAWVRASGRWSRADLDHALAALLQADISLKQSRVSSDEQILSTAILSMCAGADGHAA